MMSPDAGGTDQVSQNRGYVAIPEVGDQVMVGFVHKHPDRPFVMGGMFHGQVGLGGGADNRVKSIQTRSGHRIIFTEDESIIITDKSGNEIHLDTTGSNINITAPETMTLNCKNMNINVSESMTSIIGSNQSTSVGQNQNTSVGNNISISAGNDIMETATGNRMEIANNRTEMVDETVLRNSKSSETFAGEININTTKENMTMQSAKTIEWNSGEKSNLF